MFLSVFLYIYSLVILVLNLFHLPTKKTFSSFYISIFIFCLSFILNNENIVIVSYLSMFNIYCSIDMATQ